MAKTLVVKLAGTVNKPDLWRLGEMRIQITPFSDGTLHPYNQRLDLRISEPIQLELTGDGHFTDSTLAQNLGTTLTLQAGYQSIYVSDSTSTLHIYNKYAITGFYAAYFDNRYHHGHWTIDCADFEGMYALTQIHILYFRVSADSPLAALRDLRNLTNLILVSYQSRIQGDLSDIAGLTGLTTLNLFEQTLVTGNISSLAGLTNLETANLSTCYKLTGDTSSIAHLHPNNGGKLTAFSYSSTGITGDWPPSA